MPVSSVAVPYKHVIAKRWNSLDVIYMYDKFLWVSSCKKSSNVVILMHGWCKWQTFPGTMKMINNCMILYAEVKRCHHNDYHKSESI